MVAQALAEGERRLAAAGVATPRLDARLLLCRAAGLSPEAILRDPHAPLAPAAAAAYGGLLARRTAHEPVARILGSREFWSLDFAVSPSVLDPRPDSEVLVAAVLRRLPADTVPCRLLDLGTGSGCLLVALLSERRCAFGVGIDASPAALAVARANAAAHGVGGRAAFAAGDWDAALAGRFDAVVANPPYVPSAAIAALAPEVARFDPLAALDGGADGLVHLARLIAAMPRLLAPRGVAAIEFGAGQGDAVLALAAARAPGLAAATVADLEGRPRALVFAAP